MAQLLVRGIDPAIVEKLKARAKRNGRSTEAEVRAILEREAAAGDRGSWEEELERVRAMFAGRTFSQSAAELIREDRER
jgi:plasmid stability protein